MSLIEEILLKKLEKLGAEPGTRSYIDYERYKFLVRSIARNPEESDILTRRLSDYLKCQL